MARGINKVILVGNLGRDPDVRYTSNGSAVANIAIATSEQWKDKQTGQQQEKTEWHRVVMFGRLGEIAGEYLRKGQQVYIEGRLQTRKWQGQDGQDRYTTEIVANEMQMLGGPRGGSTDFNQGGSQAGHQGGVQSGGGAPSGGQAPAGQASGGQAPAPSSGGNFDDFDDDIPF